MTVWIIWSEEGCAILFVLHTSYLSTYLAYLCHQARPCVCRSPYRRVYPVATDIRHRFPISPPLPLKKGREGDKRKRSQSPLFSLACCHWYSSPSWNRCRYRCHWALFLHQYFLVFSSLSFPFPHTFSSLPSILFPSTSSSVLLFGGFEFKLPFSCCIWGLDIWVLAEIYVAWIIEVGATCRCRGWVGAFCGMREMMDLGLGLG